MAFFKQKALFYGKDGFIARYGRDTVSFPKINTEKAIKSNILFNDSSFCTKFETLLYDSLDDIMGYQNFKSFMNTVDCFFFFFFKKYPGQGNWVKSAMICMYWGTELTKNELVNFLIDYYNPRLDNFTEVKQDIDNFDLK